MAACLHREAAAMSHPVRIRGWLASAHSAAPRMITFFRRGRMTDKSVEAPSCLRDSTVGPAGALGAASVSVAPLGPSCRSCWLRGARGRRTGRLARARQGRPGRRAGGSGRHWLIASAALPAMSGL